MEKQVEFYDVINAININNGIVKIILGNQSTNQIIEGEGKGDPTPTKMIAIPLQTFIYALAVFTKEPKNEDMITKMQEAIEDQKSKV